LLGGCGITELGDVIEDAIEVIEDTGRELTAQVSPLRGYECECCTLEA
jgi:hypothetical protein